MIHVSDAALTGLQIRPETAADFDAREALLDAALGPARTLKTCERLREGRLPALALAAERAGRLVGTVRLWNISAGPGRAALMLGPLAVDGAARSEGLGGKLMRAALTLAAATGHEAVLLVGDAPYYQRFGFSADLTSALWMPGPVERERFLGLELKPDALRGAHGLVSPTGVLAPKPDLDLLVAAMAAGDEGLRRAA
ncbi:GCN5 family N-acetyltransferase [Alsobacter metallidurans]|uniref:GCN5 family N-acetyltransferase n=1 Tax=Alsobacter metallidurans TaxID=340221 RepID=A0A917IBW0_9HYPH|nr:N-acetyltransferase [Alsobacter metallidurans]GGH30668.1 GCN5 family N-acetyltransferase [Alsobacter metallidurans]